MPLFKSPLTRAMQEKAMTMLFAGVFQHVGTRGRELAGTEIRREQYHTEEQKGTLLIRSLNSLPFQKCSDIGLREFMEIDSS